MRRIANNHTRGFTIVELLIVIVLIGILAAITVVAYNGVQDRARNSKIASDIKVLVTAVQGARTNNSSVLLSVTGSTYTGGACTGKPDGTDLASLPKTDSCWVSYANALTKISNLSGINVNNLTDPWGRPYFIDENEGEGAGNCTKDTISAFKLPFTTGFGSYSTTPTNNVANAGFTGC